MFKYLKNKEIRNGIISSIIATIVWLSAQPVLEFLYNYLFSSSALLYNSYINSIYKSAAINSNEVIVDFIYFLSLVVISIIIMRYSISIMIKAKEVKQRSLLRKEERDEKEKLNKMSENERLKYKSEKLEKSKERLESLEIEYYESVSKMDVYLKRYKIFLVIYSIIFLIYVFNIIFKQFSQTQLRITFNQQIVQLAPFISEQQEEELKSEWASMKDRSDFILIRDKLQSLAKTYSIKFQQDFVGE